MPGFMKLVAQTLLVLSFCCQSILAAQPRPNILFIYVEDLGYYTSERALREPNTRIAGLETPNLDRLAQQSVNFTRSFCGQSVCSPSKGAIYSGLLPHANGIWRNVHNAHPKFGKPDNWIPLPSPLTNENDPTNLAVPGMHDDLPNFVQLLKSKNVYCALSGKLHVRNIDSFVGTILNKLESSGQADRTIVVFTGDHGIGCQRGKTSIYPAGTQVPCFIKGPGVKTGRTIATPISQMDFNPTFLEVFGAEAETLCHGKSLWPILSGQRDELPDRKSVMTETNNSFMSAPAHRGDSTAARAVCDGRYYYIGNLIQDRVTLPEIEAIHVGSGHGEYGDPGPQYAIDLHDETVRNNESQPLPYELLRQLCMNDAPKEELYDLDADPWGVNNLIGDPGHAETLATMRNEFTKWRIYSNDRDIHPRLIPSRHAN